MPKSNKQRSKSSSNKDGSDKKKKSDKKQEKKPKEVEEVVEEVVEEEVVDTPQSKKEEAHEEVAEGGSEGVKRARRQVTKESILEDFDGLLKDLDAEVEALRTTDNKTRKSKGVKFLRSVVKRVKTLRADSSRVMRTRKQSQRPKNTSSGFMKPVQISQEMAKFTGWEPDVPRSRVDVTKYLCQYIRDNDLQNPEDRRIIRPDNQLKTLLKLQGQDTEKNPLTYYSLQKSIQHHFTNENKTTA